jgi:hypothetical protein
MDDFELTQPKTDGEYIIHNLFSMFFYGAVMYSIEELKSKSFNIKKANYGK